MKITLINKDQLNTLKTIQKEHSSLTFQNNGYEYINKSKLTDSDKKALLKVESILKNHVDGFEKFNNFRLTKDNKVQIRLQYNYNYDNNNSSFYGVGYLLLDELFNGFKSLES